MDQAEEIRRLIEESAQGNWIPLAIVSGVFGIVIMLLIHIWNQMIKDNDKRHSKTEEILEKLTNNQTSTQVLLERIEFQIGQHEKDIDRLTTR